MASENAPDKSIALAPLGGTMRRPQSHSALGMRSRMTSSASNATSAPWTATTCERSIRQGRMPDAASAEESAGAASAVGAAAALSSAGAVVGAAGCRT